MQLSLLVEMKKKGIYFVKKTSFSMEEPNLRQKAAGAGKGDCMKY